MNKAASAVGETACSGGSGAAHAVAGGRPCNAAIEERALRLFPSVGRPRHLWLCVLALAVSTVHAAEKVSFNRDVRPILSDICFKCHGPDEKERKGELRLDIREAAMKGGESGPAFVPGEPDKSELFKRLVTHDPDDLMPPKKSGKALTPAQIDTFRRWIAEGAEYQAHWAFLNPVRPPVPEIRPDAARPTVIQNPIDTFIRARLEKEGLKPQSEAARETLIRRVTLDLTGIPPTSAEVDAFVADSSPEAYEKVVDRALASPRYGEHMAVRWLDLARYADSHGFQSDSSRKQWPWRDWVIKAFNDNKPFDQFTIEQIGGDLLPEATRGQILATGFNRNHRLNGEGGRIEEEWFAETVIDRVETTGLTWMALTLNCCRCHDHKYDPISQKEFYQLFAYFNSNKETGVLEGDGKNTAPILAVPTMEQEPRMAQFDRAIKEAEARVLAATNEMSAAQGAWEQGLRTQLKDQAPAWKPLDRAEVKSTGGATFTRQADGSFLAGGNNPGFDTYVITAPIAAGIFSGLLLEVLPDASLPNKSIGRNENGSFVLTDVDAEIVAPGLAKPVEVVFTRAEAEYSQKGFEVGLIVQDKAKRASGSKNTRGWAVDAPTKREPRKAMFASAAPVKVPAGATVRVTMRHDALPNHNIGRFRLSTAAREGVSLATKGSELPPSIVTALNTEPSKRTDSQRAELAKLHSASPESPVKKAEASLAAARKAKSDFESGFVNAMVMQERPQAREARILKRGEYDKPGDVVPRALPAVLPPLPEGAPNNRLGFAKWLVSGSHPLTARVWVNREWERFFGAGIAKTTENFGSQADWPSHPELLDWLATEFVRLKWDMKAMQKTIVMSATYRQSSRATPELLARDPENRLLARGPRFRLGAEALRDQALAISGLLVEKLGGPSVRPYMPAGVWDETSVYGDLRNYKPDIGEGLYRRTLYTFWKRTAAPPTAMLFDSPTREICTVKRSRTNTPLQALALLNETTSVEAARVLAQRMLAEGGSTPGSRIAWAFQRATCRRPTADELRILADGLGKRIARFRGSPAETGKLLKVGEAKADPKLDPVELAAYTVTANIVLNLDEVITRE